MSSLHLNKSKTNKSLPTANARDTKKGRIHLFACKRGSFTLEAAVIYPLVAAFWVSILFFFRMMQVETEVQEALYYAGRMTAVEACCTENNTALFASAEAFFRKELSGNSYAGKYIKGGTGGVTLLGSDVKGDYVSLQATYVVKFPISFFNLSGVTVKQRSSNRKWTGRFVSDGGDEDETYVYYTDYGTVYHLTDHCSYLDLKIKSTSYSSVGSLRSKSGAKYYACSLCKASTVKSGTVYYTTYGNCYHKSLSCSGLKRTVHKVPLSSVAGMRACSKCGGSK